MADGRVTQVPVEILSVGTPHGEVTQAPVELLTQGNPYALITQAPAEYLTQGSPSALVTQAPAEYLTRGNPHALVTQVVIEILSPNIPPRLSISQLVVQPVQTRSFNLQVWRNGVWVDIPVQSVKGSLQKGQAGHMKVTVKDNQSDAYRSRIYEGEKIRAFRGVTGQTAVRCWTGYVDAPTVSDQVGITRDISVTDYVQELNNATLLQGVILDNLEPMGACAQLIQTAIDTGQFVPSDDVGTLLTGATVNFQLPSGNGICYFPFLKNPDGSTFILASGQLGSYTSGPFPYASLMVPIPSGGSPPYLTYTLPNQYLIPGQFALIGFGLASGTTLPPPPGSASVDYFNGILYFNPADQGKTLYASATFFQSPLWAYKTGTKVADIISEIMDKSGCRWGVDGYGKFWSKYIDTTSAPSRIFPRSQYITNSIQSNRDRRNVIICEGWDSVLSQLIVAKSVNFDDINNPPPVGLGKRQYMIIQDQSWRSQDTVNMAAYYAAQQVGRRGKVMSATIIDDPTIALESVVGFEGALPETSTGDFFYVEGLEWTYSAKKGMEARTTMTGTMLPGRGTVFVGPMNALTSYGQPDYTIDVTPIASATLTPSGGSFSSNFSLSSMAGLKLGFTVRSSQVSPKLTIYGSDGSILGPYTAPVFSAGAQVWQVPTSGMNPGIMYAIKSQFTDPSGNIAFYRDFIVALP